MVKKNFTVSDGVVINSKTGNIGFEVHTTDAMKIPEGNTSTRPSLSSNGLFRYNPADQLLDARENSTWKKGFLGNTISQDSDLGTLTFSQNVDIINSTLLAYNFRLGSYTSLSTGSNTVYYYFRTDNNYLRFWKLLNSFELYSGSNLVYSNSTVTQVGSVNASSVSVGGNNMVGRQARWIPASGMEIPLSGPNIPQRGSMLSSNGQIWLETLDFDSTNAEFAFFTWAAPKSWDGGGVRFVPVWSHPATTTNFGVTWEMFNRSYTNGDRLTTDILWGFVQSIDTGGTTDDIYIGPESSNATIQNSPATDDLIVFRVQRIPTDGNDTLAVDAKLIGITLYYWTTAVTDE